MDTSEHTPSKRKSRQIAAQPSVDSRNQVGRVRMEDIAREVGVSRRVVSRALFPEGSHGIRVGEETIKKIREVAARQGYIPNISAMHLKGGSTRLVGVLIDSFASEVSYKILHRLERGMSEKGYRLLIGQIHRDVMAVEDYLRDFVSRGVESVITFAHGYPEYGDEIDKLYRSIQRVVYVGSRMDREHLPENASNVYVDMDEGVFNIMDHLFGNGQQRIVLLQSGSGYPSEQDRYRGYMRALQKHGLESLAYVENVMRKGEQQVLRESLHAAVDRIIAKCPEVQAIITCNDYCAQEVIYALHHKGIKVPDHVRVTGVDNMLFSQCTVPTITTLDQRIEALAQHAISLVSQDSEGMNMQRCVRLVPELLIRESSVFREGS